MTVTALSTIRFRGLIAPEETPTGDFRIFARNSLTHRRLPKPVMFSRTLTRGHLGAVTVGRLEAVEYVPGRGWIGSGSFLDPRMVPEVAEAVYLVQLGVSSPSVDLQPNATAEIVPHPMKPDDELIRVTTGRIMGFTFVPYPAFEEVEITVESAKEVLILASSAPHRVRIRPDRNPQGLFNVPSLAQFAVNSSTWRSFPIAERETVFNYDQVVPRLVEWSGGASAKFKRAFLYQVSGGDVTSTDSYLLPVADVVDGRLVLIPRAVFSAAAFLSGAHGGLPQVPENDQESLRNVVTDIYETLREKFGDPRLRPPWTRGGRQEARGAHDMETFQNSDGDRDCPEGKHWDDDAGKCMANNSDDDGEQPAEDRNYTSVVAASAPVEPPRAWFENPFLAGATPLNVADDGRVFGHLASWDTCHTGFKGRCVTAPHSTTNYSLFKVGEVKCNDGSRIPVGKITLGTGHASAELGVVPATEHYDDTGACVAVVNVGEDRYGIWVAGSVVPTADEARVAELRRSPLSGDWRKYNGNLELVAALAVNSPGFPVLRASANSEDDLETLVAAGIVSDTPPPPPDPNPDDGEDRGARWKRLVDVVRTERVRNIFGG